MLDSKILYDAYKECAWREYGLVEKRANWVYIGNTVLAVGLGFIIQQQIGLIAQPDALQRIGADPYTASIFSISKLVIVAVPAAAIVINVTLWSQMLAASRAAESVRLRWRLVHDDPRRDAAELPYLSFGFRDAGPKPNGWLPTSLLPMSLIFFWVAMLLLGLHLVFPDVAHSAGTLLSGLRH